MNLVSIGEICALRNGRAFKPTDWSTEGSPIIRIQNLTDESKPFNYCNFEVDSKFHVNKGDLLFSWSGTPGTSFGAFFWRRQTGYLNQHIFRIDPYDLNSLNLEYFRLALNSKLEEIISQAHGGVGLQHITKEKLNKIKVYLPELKDQIRIAHLLGKVEGLIAQRKQGLQQLDELLKSVFLEMFGDPVKNEKGWPVVYWDDLFITRTGRLNANAMSEDGSFPFFTCAKEIFYINVFAFDCEALILAGNNATGDYDVKYYNGKFNAYQRTYILELKIKGDEYAFFKHHLEMKLRQLKDGSKGANTRYLTKQFLETIGFIRPHESYQREFTDISQKITALKSRYQQSLSDLEALYGALSQKAFKGELDLSRVPLLEIPEPAQSTQAPGDKLVPVPNPLKTERLFRPALAPRGETGSHPSGGLAPGYASFGRAATNSTDASFGRAANITPSLHHESDSHSFSPHRVAVEAGLAGGKAPGKIHEMDPPRVASARLVGDPQLEDNEDDSEIADAATPKRRLNAAALQALSPAAENFLREKTQVTSAEVQASFQLSGAQARKILQGLVDAGKVRIEGAKKGTRYVAQLR